MGYEDKHEEDEGILYSAGAFDGAADDVVGPGPNKRARKNM